MSEGCKILFRKPEGRYRLNDLGLNWRVTLKLILSKLVVRMQTGFQLSQMNNSWEEANEFSDFINGAEF